MKRTVNAEPVRAMTEAEIAAAMREWGPLVDLPLAAFLARVSEQRMRALWHASAFRQIFALGRYMVRLVEVERWIQEPAMRRGDRARATGPCRFRTRIALALAGATVGGKLEGTGGTTPTTGSCVGVDASAGNPKCWRNAAPARSCCQVRRSRAGGDKAQAVADMHGQHRRAFAQSALMVRTRPVHPPTGPTRGPVAWVVSPIGLRLP